MTLGCSKALIDLREGTGGFEVLERYSAASGLAEFLDRRIQLAAVAEARLILSDKFAETVARNRGLNVRVFSDFDEALGWLLDMPS